MRRRRRRLGWRPATRLPPGVLALGALGLGAAVTLNFLTELSSVPTTLPPFVAALQGYLPAAAFAYASAWLHRSDFNPIGRWQVVIAGYGGLLLFGGTTAITILVRAAEGRPVGEPQYALFATAGAGGVAGLLVGVLYARSVRTAEIAAETRDQFELMNSILRHDILNRTMVIRSRANFIADETEGRTAEFADTIVTQSDDVADQVERTRALLDALSGEDRELSATPLSAAVAENVTSLRATHESLELRTDVPEVDVLADETLVDVVGNVLSNAVDHNDEQTPRIEVTADETDSYVDLRVADNGPGVPDEVKDAIFRRDETGLHEDGTGSGFGLFFVDAMLSDFGGDVWVEDRASWRLHETDEPGGSVFVLRFRRPGLAEP
ncbi:sensor histidine kinase [Halosegnis sp.]|uniref:sensor histidine kinase n=1 Tax=Halosegnis sp. TaxID=2864959 RepID=UPI0035D4C5D7